MLKSLKIENFRCFKSFEMQNLGRINLLVGANNSGKTSVLEALYLLTSTNEIKPLIEIIINRGEYYYTSEPIQNYPDEFRRELEICHLFYNHEFDIGSEVLIVADTNDGQQNFSASVMTEGIEIFKDFGKYYLLIKWFPKKDPSKLNIMYPIHISLNNTIVPNKNGLYSSYQENKEKLKNLNSSTKTQFLTSSFLTSNSMIDLFNEVVLTSKEDKVIEALKIIEPTIERIAPISERYRSTESRTGFLVRLSGSDQRIPIGSMGDGIWRILGITLALVNAENGVLLIDEIDTGLHYSTLSDMWRLVWETAKKLNVQVFATTHSRDCWESLADISNRENPHEDGITIHRIERDKPSSIVFDEPEIVIAVEQGGEVR